MALNHYFELGYEFFHWRTRKHEAVDLILYGEKGFFAFEFKSSARIQEADFAGLNLFGEDYPMAKRIIVYGGHEDRVHRGIQILSAATFFENVESLLKSYKV